MMLEVHVTEVTYDSRKRKSYNRSYKTSGFKQVSEILECHGIFEFHFVGLESRGNQVFVTENHGK